jgi:hypothetical protein
MEWDVDQKIRFCIDETCCVLKVNVSMDDGLYKRNKTLYLVNIYYLTKLTTVGVAKFSPRRFIPCISAQQKPIDVGLGREVRIFIFFSAICLGIRRHKEKISIFNQSMLYIFKRCTRCNLGVELAIHIFISNFC